MIICTHDLLDRNCGNVVYLPNSKNSKKKQNERKLTTKKYPQDTKINIRIICEIVGCVRMCE